MTEKSSQELDAEIKLRLSEAREKMDDMIGSADRVHGEHFATAVRVSVALIHAHAATEQIATDFAAFGSDTLALLEDHSAAIGVTSNCLQMGMSIMSSLQIIQAAQGMIAEKMIALCNLTPEQQTECIKFAQNIAAAGHVTVSRAKP